MMLFTPLLENSISFTVDLSIRRTTCATAAPRERHAARPDETLFTFTAWSLARSEKGRSQRPDHARSAGARCEIAGSVTSEGSGQRNAVARVCQIWDLE